MRQIPVDLIAGRKHTGKTTLINALLQGPFRNQRAVIFTNEMGNTPYASTCQITPVLGGCICCTAQTELVAKIRNLLWFDTPDRIVVEMSGSGTLEDMLRIFTYLPECRLYQLIYVLDARKYLALSAIMGDGLTDQLRLAPVIALTNWERVTSETQEQVVEKLRSANPEVQLCTNITQLDPEQNHSACQAVEKRLGVPIFAGEIEFGTDDLFQAEPGAARFRSRTNQVSGYKRVLTNPLSEKKI